MDSVASHDQPQRAWPVMGVAACLLPLAAASVALLWFSFGGGDVWAHSLFGTKHPLNLGGNPSEVFSHLLNGVVMATSVALLCTVLLSSIWFQRSQSGEVALSTILVTGMLMVCAWAAYLDSRSGEGTVAISFIMFFGPGVAFSRMAAQGLVSSPTARLPRALVVLALTGISLGMIWLYEPSGTGGPNLLVVPLLTGQVCLFWLASRRFRKMAGAA
jgi:hypothetical protein